MSNISVEYFTASCLAAILFGVLGFFGGLLVHGVRHIYRQCIILKFSVFETLVRTVGFAILLGAIIAFGLKVIIDFYNSDVYSTIVLSNTKTIIPSWTLILGGILGCIIGLNFGKNSALAFMYDKELSDFVYFKRSDQIIRRSELETYVQKLIYISNLTATSSGYGFLRLGKEQSRNIGEELNEKWGFDVMVYVCERIRDELGSGPYRELEYAWNGIGDWRG